MFPYTIEILTFAALPLAFYLLTLSKCSYQFRKYIYIELISLVALILAIYYVEGHYCEQVVKRLLKPCCDTCLILTIVSAAKMGVFGLRNER